MSPQRPELTGSDEPQQSSDKRRLLLIYIHGFLGSEDSFHKFPKHVHDLLTLSLGDTHTIYTKIYPRYKTRGPLKIARENLLQWLSPHESPDLDIILLGHSLGGLVAADVSLSHVPTGNRILGLVNFDVPFLGLHPRVVTTGIGRLFHHKPDADTVPDEEDTTFGPLNDATFDPTFPNDVTLPKWTGWDGARHFIAKHSHHLSRAAVQYVFSYYDHAGCLNNYPALFKRYNGLCQVEAVDELAYADSGRRRVRFVNFYTASTGVVKKRPSRNLDVDLDLGLESSTTLDSQGSSINSSRSSHLDRKSDSTPSSTFNRKFCCLPRDSDPCRDLWVPVHMEGMDEITAHQSMFVVQGSHYDMLVGDTVSHIESWIRKFSSKATLIATES